MSATNTYGFGTGSVICRANGIPTKIGTLQEIEIDISSDIVELMGQNQYAEAIARGKSKVEGKAKTGRIDMKAFSSLYLGTAIDTSGYTKLIEGETHSIPSSGGPYTVQVTNHTSAIEDMGVFYADGSGQLSPVAAGSEATGKYSVAPATGTFTFAAGDSGKALLFSYAYLSANGSRVIVTNQAMGINPVFELLLSNGYANINGIIYTSMKLYSCVANKLTFPFKNSDFVVSELDFSAFSDPNGNVLEFGIGT